MTKEFLLNSPIAQRLYHEHAEHLPIVDYHCHLSPKMIAEDYRFRSITELWLGGDHYKWRAMRANGIDEHYITGDATDWEKFQKWAETVPYTLRNPLYHWTHMELSTAFGINKILKPETAREIYDQCNDLLQQEGYSARGLMLRYGVRVVCTTDDPIDTLEYHRQIREDGFAVKVLPAWRPDKAMAVADAESYNEYVDKLEAVCGMTISTYSDLIAALQQRHDFFAENGCVLADHGVSQFPWAECTQEEAEELFGKVRQKNLSPTILLPCERSVTPCDAERPTREGEDVDSLISCPSLNALEVKKLQSYLLLDLARMNARKGWAQQFHVGPLRNTCSRLYRRLGADIGCDTMGDWRSAEAMASFFDALDVEGLLAKTIIYNINPSDNDVFATMIANFQDGSMPGKMQWGSGWWFNDQLDGMEKQLNTLSLHGLLSRFIGMLTDSRSFVSYPRHDYFRRLLCSILARDLEAGLIPMEEMPQVERMIEDICYNNAIRYFGWQ